MPKDMNEEEALESAVKFSERYVDRGPYEFFPEIEVVEESDNYTKVVAAPFD